jgi:nucleotide-binding universal stress UspA family protein
MQPILLATDGSPSAQAATGEAIELAAQFDAPLVVACVLQDPTPAYGYYGYAEIAAELRAGQEKRIEEVFAAVAEQAAAAGVDCELLRLEGVPGEQICRAADDGRARMIVLGAHGWGPIRRLIHGSVSTHVLHHASVPVLVVQATAVGAVAQQ